MFFLVETLVISNVYENLSVETGFPFGHYHYTGGPQLVHVPIYIGPVYVGLGYLCWRLAGLILAGRRLTDAGGKSPPDTSSAVDLAPNGVVMCMAACCPVGGAPRWRGRTPPTSR
ncbi:hypothetical protein C1I93_01230 [Micromonospora endophytica]|uniref:Uncharacterized protein n=1 Tax=Micromonospora endophytica TaxID=515350 RepID=A0A2W2CSR4_9ACTN|nr:hypothetical protein C1I93_01230 [Micromonospora endophytica]RIW46259.1 carotenoid biosynthesis protein [Micromonospora endophytica]